MRRGFLHTQSDGMISKYHQSPFYTLKESRISDGTSLLRYATSGSLVSSCPILITLNDAQQTMRLHSFLPTLLSSTFLFSQVLADAQSYTLNIGNAYIAPDGFYRSASVANGQFPGPLLSANKGDTMQVTVNNQLSDSRMRRSTSIHWHGM